MKVKTVVEQPDGNYVFQAELTPDQHAFLIEYAVRDLIKQGLIPFIQTPEQRAENAIVVAQPVTDEAH